MCGRWRSWGGSSLGRRGFFSACALPRFAQGWSVFHQSPQRLEPAPHRDRRSSVPGGWRFCHVPCLVRGLAVAGLGQGRGRRCLVLWAAVAAALVQRRGVSEEPWCEACSSLSRWCGSGGCIRWKPCSSGCQCSDGARDSQGSRGCCGGSARVWCVRSRQARGGPLRCGWWLCRRSLRSEVWTRRSRCQDGSDPTVLRCGSPEAGEDRCCSGWLG